MARWLLSIISISALAVSCSDGLDTATDLRSVVSEESALSVNSVGSGSYEFGLSLPVDHENMEGKEVDVSSYVSLASRRISLACREGAKKEYGSKIIVILKETSGDGSKKSEVVNFPYLCVNGAVARLSNLDPSYSYELTVLVLSRKGLIYQAQSSSFRSDIGKLVLKMSRVNKSDSDQVIVDIDFPKESTSPKVAKAALMKCVFNVSESHDAQSSDDNLGDDTIVNSGSCKLQPVKKVGIEEKSSEPSVLLPSGGCLGSQSCLVKLDGLVYPHYYRVDIHAGDCNRTLYVKAVPGEEVSIPACRP